jgi:hypothetical protein
MKTYRCPDPPKPDDDPRPPVEPDPTGPKPR